MSKKGQNNITGIEAQQWAALSLFLQYLSNPNFDRIELEPVDFHDFNLVFSDGHKIICESKCEKRNFTYADLKKLLKSTLIKHEINQNDVILVVCLNLSDALLNNVKMMKYLPDEYGKRFKSKHFTKAEIELISRIKFWKVSPENNKAICSALLSEYFDFWVPKEDMARFTDVLKQYFNDAASRGSVFSRDELRANIRQLGAEIVTKTGLYDEERRRPEEMVRGLVEALKNDRDPVWTQYPLAALSTQPYLLHYVFLNIKSKSGIDLSKWDDLWQLNRWYGFSFNVFHVFSNNLHSKINRQYILTYIKNNVSALRGFYRLDFFIDGAVRIAEKILLKDPSLADEIFKTIRSLLASIEDEILYVENNLDRDHQRKTIARLLSLLYDKTSSKIANEIAEYSATTFDLVHGRHDTPGAIFSILYKYLTSAWKIFPERFEWLVKNLIRQYANFYEGRLNNGWDHMGSTGAFWGRDYQVKDLEFVEIILKPALNQFYERSHRAAWAFIKEHCIISQKRVSKNRPDFLNRSAIPVVLKQYKYGNKKDSKEAFEILKEFILSTKGIPVKFELIYQEVRDDRYTDEQKWQLVQVSLIDKYGNLPITPFVEQIVTNLAKKGHVEARNALTHWFSDAEYFRKYRIVDNAIPNIEALIDSDFELAISLFKKFIGNEVFINKKDEFDTYDAAVILQKILDRDYAKGLEILNELIRIQKPTINQQILISHGYFHHRNPNEKEDKRVLTRIYNDFIKPNLAKFSDYNYLTHSHSRDSFIQFARKLAISELIGEALVTVKAFMNDPDPYPPGKDPEDSKGEFSEQKRMEEKGEVPSTINSVRGWCAWALASCPAIPSRAYVSEIIGLTKKLLDDPDWYVRHMACFSLRNLAQNRLSVMPPKKEKLYLNDDKAEALKMAKSIEKMAFGLLEELSMASCNVQKAMAKSVLSPFEHIRALNQEDADRFIDILSDCTDPVVIQAAPFLIYLAEFRKRSYAHDNPKWQMKDYYDDLKEFDDTQFKELLDKLISEKSKKEVRSRLSWEYWALVRNYEDKFDEHFPIALKYLQLAAQEYEHSVFENIYRFIDDCIDIQFEECFSLWKICLETEKTFFNKHFDPYSMYWWPHHYNGRILLTIKEQPRAGDKAFIECLKFLSSYPEGSRLDGLREAVEELIKMPSKYNKMIGEIFDNLINKRKEVNYCDLKDAWMNKKKK